MPFIAALRSTSLLVVFLAVVGELERELVGRVVLQHVEDEAFLDGLAHRIHVERLRQAVRPGPAEQLQRLLPWAWR